MHDVPNTPCTLSLRLFSIFVALCFAYRLAQKSSNRNRRRRKKRKNRNLNARVRLSSLNPIENPSTESSSVYGATYAQRMQYPYTGRRGMHADRYIQTPTQTPSTRTRRGQTQTFENAQKIHRNTDTTQLQREVRS